MRLFVTDECPFLQDPANCNVDAAAKERRKYEQDELRETAQSRRLKTKLDEIKTAQWRFPILRS